MSLVGTRPPTLDEWEKYELHHPSIAPETRGSFFENLDKGFYKAVLKCAPKVYYKQKLKECLIKLKIIRGGANRIEYKISFWRFVLLSAGL